MSYTPFKEMEAKLKARGVKSPGGLAATIARRKYGKAAVQRAASHHTSLRHAKVKKRHG